VAETPLSRSRAILSLIGLVVAAAAVAVLLAGRGVGPLVAANDAPSAPEAAREIADAIAAHDPSRRWVVSCQPAGAGVPTAPCIVYAVLPAGAPLQLAYGVTWDARDYLHAGDTTGAGTATEVLPASQVDGTVMIDDVVCADLATTRRFTFLAMGGELDRDLPTADAYAAAAGDAHCRLVHVAPVGRGAGYADVAAVS
jgi:hypothetical protein